MKRTIIAAVLLTAASGTVATVPAFAAPAADTSGAGAAAGLAPDMLQAMQRDFGLSQDQAVARITSENAAAHTEQRLRGSLGDAFGGAFYDVNDGKLVVGVTNADAMGTVDNAGAKATVVRNSASRLDATMSTLDRAAAPSAVTGWFVDVQRNTVTVTTAPGTTDAARSFVSAAGVDSALTNVVESTEAPRALADIRGGDAYLINNQSRCSIGFSVQGGYVTAGHCGTRGATTTSRQGAAQGTFQGSSFPGNDYAWVRTNSSWTPRGVVNRYNGSTVRVSGSQSAAVGASVCRSGSTTGWHCGTIQTKNTSVRYPEGTISGVTKTSVCAEPGDSGGSYISGAQAQGVTSGGSGNCSTGGTTYFQPVNEILSVYGLRLVTS
ncbi:MAG: S1 family peptidase [Actinomycetota bacterium]|nr:S1 family peptidase [Actinomycetota bacterium]